MSKTVYDCCSWVLVNATKTTAPVICKKPTQWRMVRDDAGNRVRKYMPFCPEHASAARLQELEEDRE